MNSEGQVAGAGTFIYANLAANYTFTSLCFNKGSDAGPVPGQSGSGTAIAPPSGPIQTVHGNATFNVTTLPISVDKSRLCPGGFDATKTVYAITFSDATLDIADASAAKMECKADLRSSPFTLSPCPARAN